MASLQALQAFKDEERLKLLVLSDADEAKYEFSSCRLSLVTPEQTLDGAITMGSASGQYYHLSSDQQPEMGGSFRTEEGDPGHGERSR